MTKPSPTFLSILGALVLVSSAGNAAEVAAVFNTSADVAVAAASYVSAAAGGHVGLASSSDGTLAAWGSNRDGRGGHPDHDGIVNLVEYVFALDPKRPGTGQLPQWQRIGDHLVISFTAPPGVTGITYGAETSIALEGEDWLPIEDSGTAPQHVFRVPIDRARRFARLQVTSGK